MSFSFRDTEGQQAHTGTRRIPDEGDYRVMISKADLEDSKKGNGAVNLAMEYTILAGDFSGVVLKEWLAVVNKSETAQNIARSKAEALRIITKLKQDAEVNALVGKELIVRVFKEPNEYTDNNGNKRTGVNAVVGNYMNLERLDAAGKPVAAFVPTVKQETSQGSSQGSSGSSQGNSSGNAQGGYTGGQSRQDLDDEIPF